MGRASARRNWQHKRRRRAKALAAPSILSILAWLADTGECRINSTYNVRKVIEVGLLQTHGLATPPPRTGGGTSQVTWDGNVAAIQITGFGGNVKIYRR